MKRWSSQAIEESSQQEKTVREVEDSFGTIGHGIQESKIMRIRQGIFQGGSLSSLLCVSLNPPSMELKRAGYGYWVSTGHGRTDKRQVISHLLYIDNMKLYGGNPDHYLFP